MTRAAIAIVGLGLAVAIATGLNLGLDGMALVYLGLLVALGALAIAVATRSDKRMVGPARCAECGGLISPNAPYCKHCNAPVPARENQG